MKKFYVYIYLDPRKPGLYKYQVGRRILKLSYGPFYAGKGNGDRYKGPHNSQRYLKNKINKIYSATGGSYKVFKFYCSSEENALLIEKLLINTIGRKDLGLGPLVNLTDGGEGCSNPSNRTRERMGRSHTGKPKKRRVGRSGYKGVYWDRCRWMVRIYFDEMPIHLGSYSRVHNAAWVYDIAAIVVYGKYAILNLPTLPKILGLKKYRKLKELGNRLKEKKSLYYLKLLIPMLESDLYQDYSKIS
jgi:hypothetical protein